MMSVNPALPVAWEDTLTDDRIQRFWVLAVIAGFLHGVADPFVTYLIVNVYAVGTEANPWLATYLQSGAVKFILIHIPLYIVIFGVSAAFTWLFHYGSDTERAQIYTIARIFWSLAILWGVLIVGNNLFVLVDGL